MDTKAPVSLWDVTAEETAGGAPLDTGQTVDVAIVGGGYTGLSTALHCAEKGLSAQVIEAETIGFGGSGRNAGLVNAAAWLPPAKVRSALGPTYGDRFVRRFSDAPRFVFDLIEKHQIRCEATKTGTIHAARGRTGLRDLEARHAEWQRLGEPVELLDADQVAKLAGTSAFQGGLLDHRAGTINPMGYCRGLARAALGAGAKIATGVRVTKLTPDGEGWIVATSAGDLRARHVVLGTNAYTDALWPGLKTVFTTIHYMQIATEPLGEAAAHILPGRQGLWDNAQIMCSLRRDAGGRLILGTMGRVLGSTDSGITRRWAEKTLARLFPELGEMAFEEAWHGQIAMTPGHLPQVHRLAPGLWTAIAYNGRGIATGTVFGHAIAGLLTGADPAELPLPVTDPASIRGGSLVTRVYDMVFTANQVWRGLR